MLHDGIRNLRSILPPTGLPQEDTASTGAQCPHIFLQDSNRSSICCFMMHGQSQGGCAGTVTCTCARQLRVTVVFTVHSFRCLELC
jgi:hypothetical protein